MSREQLGGTLIGQGSFGCVFKPALRCPGKKEEDDSIVSKVFFGEDSHKDSNEELRLDVLIRNIKGNKQWSHIWDKGCKPYAYDKLYKVEPDIEVCLEGNNVSEHEYNKYRKMLQGPDAGTPLLNKMMKEFTPSVLNNKAQFRHTFMDLMVLMKPLFLGLKDMYNTGVSHNDIKDDNIMVDKDGCKYIDFGLASEYTNKVFYEKRSKSEFIHDRIYPPYPYEYIYLYASLEVLEDEYSDRLVKVYRGAHDRYVLIHEKIFNRNTTINLNNLILRYIDGMEKNQIIKPANRRILLSLIDTYSLGMLIPSCLCKLAKKHGKMNKLKNMLHNEPVKSFIALFKHMTEPDYFNRIYPIDAYDKYLELEKIYLSEHYEKHAAFKDCKICEDHKKVHKRIKKCHTCKKHKDVHKRIKKCQTCKKHKDIHKRIKKC